MTIPTHIWEAYWSEAKPGTEAALERVIAELAKPPTAFRWTPEMRALWPDHMRPTMTGLLAIWEALQGAAEYSDEQPEPFPGARDGWIKWDGGECPVKPSELVEIELRNGKRYEDEAPLYRWAHSDTSASAWRRDIIAYRVIK